MLARLKSMGGVACRDAGKAGPAWTSRWRCSLRMGAVGALLASSAAVAGPRLSPNGIGPIRIGMTTSRLETVVRQRFGPPERPESEACFHVEAKAYPGLRFMIMDGTLRRIEVSSRRIRTVEGIRIGDRVGKVKKLFGDQLLDEPHAYMGPQGRYLTVYSSGSGLGIRFETDQLGRKVGQFHAGGAKEIQYIEGCL